MEMTNKNRNMITAAVLVITAFTRTGILTSALQQVANARNFTGSVRIAPTLLQTIQSKSNVSLTTAATNAERGVGTNSHAIFARLGIVNGYLVYIIYAMDVNHNIHRITVDAGNGKVLTSEQIPFGQGSMFGQGGMMGLGGMFGQGGMMGLGGNYSGVLR
jgi:hypothetical protein